MLIEIAGMSLEIPDDLVEERMKVAPISCLINFKDMMCEEYEKE